MEQNAVNVWTVVVGLSGAFVIGMSFAALGSISVKLMPRLNIDEGKFGSLVSTFMFSCVIASLAMGAGMDALGYKATAVIGFAASGIALFMLANAKSIKAAAVATILLGIGAMAASQIGNVLGTAAIKASFGWGPAASNNLVNVFFGLGLFLMPFLVSFLFQKMSYAKAISILGVVMIIPTIFVFLATYPEAAGFNLAEAFSLLGEPVVIVSSLMLFCYVALESSFTNWLAPVGKEVVSKETPEMDGEKVDASAARLLSAFAIAMMAGRLIASLSGITVVGSWLIVGCAAAAAVIILGMMGVTRGGLAFALAAAAGFVFGPVFPTSVGVTYAKFGGGSGILFGIIFAVALMGAVIVPKAIGNASKGSSVQKSLKLLLPIVLVLAVLAILLSFLKDPADNGSATGQEDTAISEESIE